MRAVVASAGAAGGAEEGQVGGAGEEAWCSSPGASFRVGGDGSQPIISTHRDRGVSTSTPVAVNDQTPTVHENSMIRTYDCLRDLGIVPLNWNLQM